MSAVWPPSSAAAVCTPAHTASLWFAAFRQPKTFYSSSTSRNVYLSVTKDVLSAKPDVVCSFVATLKIKNRWPWPRWSRLPDKDSFANDMTTSKTSTLQFIDCIDDCIEHIRDIINHMYNYCRTASWSEVRGVWWQVWEVTPRPGIICWLRLRQLRLSSGESCAENPRDPNPFSPTSVGCQYLSIYDVHECNQRYLHIYNTK